MGKLLQACTNRDECGEAFHAWNLPHKNKLPPCSKLACQGKASFRAFPLDMLVFYHQGVELWYISSNRLRTHTVWTRRRLSAGPTRIQKCAPLLPKQCLTFLYKLQKWNSCCLEGKQSPLQQPQLQKTSNSVCIRSRKRARKSQVSHRQVAISVQPGRQTQAYMSFVPCEMDVSKCQKEFSYKWQNLVWSSD